MHDCESVPCVAANLNIAHPPVDYNRDIEVIFKPAHGTYVGHLVSWIGYRARRKCRRAVEAGAYPWPRCLAREREQVVFQYEPSQGKTAVRGASSESSRRQCWFLPFCSPTLFRVI